MMKKSVFVTLMVAIFALGAAFSFSSCKKTEGDLIPVVKDVLRGPNDFTICNHCGDTIYDLNYATNPVYPYDWDHFHQHFYGPAYLPALYCPMPNCFWQGRNHVHEVYYWVDENGHHYEDDWIHLGGGAGGE